MKRLLAPALALGLAAAPPAPSHAAPPPPNAVHVRGTVQSVTGKSLTVTTVTGAETVQLAPPVHVLSVTASSRAAVKPGAFVGIASIGQPDGTQRATEIVVFPASMRGAGEGSYPWDTPGTTNRSGRMTNGTVGASSAGRGKMTNGTVATGAARRGKMTNGTVARSAGGSTLDIAYGSAGRQAITIPPGIPVVTFSPGVAAQLKPGAHVFVNAMKGADGSLKAAFVAVGKNGVVPPM